MAEHMHSPLPLHPLRRRPALILLLCAMPGIMLTRLLPGEFVTCLLLAIIALLLLAGSWWIRAHRRLLAAIATLASLVLLAYSLSALAQQPAGNDLSVRHPEGADCLFLRLVVVEGTGSAALDPLQGDDTPGVDARLPQVFHQAPVAPPSALVAVHTDLLNGLPLSGQARIYLPEGTVLQAGESLDAWVAMQRFPTAKNPGEADLRQLYADRGVHSLLLLARPEHVVSRDTSGRFWRAPLRVSAEAGRAWVDSAVGQRMEPGQRAMLHAMVLGDRSLLPRDLREAFLQSGTLHLLVVSGLHVLMLGLGVRMLLGWLGWTRRRTSLVVSVIALAYLVLTGMQTATLRAVSLLVLMACADWAGRRPDFLNLLAASAVLVLLREPADLFSAGFQLSFLSVLALHLVIPMLRREPQPEDPMVSRSALRPVAGWAGGVALASLVATAATAPIVARNWFLFTPGALLANVIATPIVMLVLGLALVLPLAAIPGLDVALASVMGLLLELLSVMTLALADTSWTSRTVLPPHLWWMLAFMLSLLVLASAHRLPLLKRQRAIAWALPLIALGLLPLATPAVQGERLHVFDVRQGSSALLTGSSGGSVLVDCGSQMRPHVGTWTIVPALCSLGVSELDCVVLSHSDADHVNGLASLLERIPVGQVVVSSDFGGDPHGQSILAWLKQGGVAVTEMARGQRMVVDGIELNALWPDARFASTTGNDNSDVNRTSLVLAARTGELSCLLTADAEDEWLAGTLHQPEGPGLPAVDVLLAPHQGSGLAGMESLLSHTRPAYVVISAREGFASQHAMQAYRANATLLTTWQSGAISFRREAGSLRWQSYVDESD